MPDSTCVFTIASKNYLAHARTVLASVQEHHPDVATYLILCDRPDGFFDPAQESFEVILAQDLGIDRFPQFAFKYTCLELNTAVKPFAIRMFFEKLSFERVVYLDPDIVVYRALSELFQALKGHDAVLTPHLTDFLPDDGHSPSNLDILRSGTNNLGFIALRRSEDTLRLVGWWCEQLYDDCRAAVTEGIFVDQKWMDLALSCVPRSALLRHPGYNVAYWNLSHRPISRTRDGEFLAAGEPLGFFHFSGFTVGARGSISKHQTRFTRTNIGRDAQAIFRDYERRLHANGAEEVRRLPYVYGRFSQGYEIPDCCRLYFQKELSRRVDPEYDPFAVSNDARSLYEVFQSRIGNSPLTHCAMALHEFHPDLQQAFPAVPGANARDYANWLIYTEGGPARLNSVFIEPVRSLLGVASEPKAAKNGTRPARSVRYAVSRFASACLRFGRNRPSLVTKLPPRLRQRIATRLRAIAYDNPDRREIPVAEPAALQPGMNVFGVLDRPIGVGEAARGMIRCFQRLGVPCHLVSFDEEHLFRGKPLPPGTQPNENRAINYCHLNADCTDALRTVFGDGTFAGRTNIGFWAWELEEFPERWDKAAEFFDEIWVPSAFVQQAVSLRARVPVIRIPHCVQAQRPAGDWHSAFGIPRDRPTILCMFDAASYVDRKNPFATIRAIKQAAAMGCDPLVILKISRPEADRDLMTRLRREIVNTDCHVIDRFLSRDETWGLLGACDLLVSLHRSEGFGLILAEAMSLGKLVVATGYSGNMDFMTPSNSFLVNFTRTTLQRDIGPYPAGSHWAEPDVEHAAEAIHHALTHPATARRIGARAAKDIAQTLGPAAIAALISSRLQRLGFSFQETPFETEAQESRAA